MITNLINYPLPDLAFQRVLAGLIILSQLVKLFFDWLRLFDSYAFFVSLITETMIDIKYFIIIYFMLLLYLGLAF